MPVLSVVVPQNRVMRASAPDVAVLMIVDPLLAARPEHSLQLQDLGYALAGQAQLYVIGFLLALQDEQRFRICASVR